MRDINPFLSKLIAHRGIHNKYIKENTKEAIKRAISLNIPVEFDVSLTKDNVVVLCHDSYIKINAKKYKIREYDYKYLKNFCQTLVTLEEILNLVKGKIPLLIELKPYARGNHLQKYTVKLLDEYKGLFAVQSFSTKIVIWFKINRKDYLTGQLLTSNYKSKIKKIFIYNKVMLLNHFIKPDFLSYNVKGLPNKKVEKIRKHKPVLGWTIENKKQLLKCDRYCDNFICNNIEEILEEL